MATYVRIQPNNYERFREMAEKSGTSLPEMLSAAIDEHYRRWLLKGLADDYARLRADPFAWAEELKERELWDATLLDGLVDS